jgi:hypothetical protein
MGQTYRSTGNLINNVKVVYDAKVGKSTISSLPDPKYLIPIN